MARERASVPNNYYIRQGEHKAGHLESLRLTDRRLPIVNTAIRQYVEERKPENAPLPIKELTISQAVEFADGLQRFIAERLAQDYAAKTQNGEKRSFIDQSEIKNDEIKLNGISLRAINEQGVKDFLGFLSEGLGKNKGANVVLAARHGDQVAFDGATGLSKEAQMQHDHNLYDPIKTSSLAEAAAVRFLQEWAFAQAGIEFTNEFTSQNYRAAEAAIVQSVLSSVLHGKEQPALKDDAGFNCLVYPSNTAELINPTDGSEPALKKDGTIPFTKYAIDKVTGTGGETGKPSDYDATIEVMREFVTEGLNAEERNTARATTTQTQHHDAMLLNYRLAQKGLSLDQLDEFIEKYPNEYEEVANTRLQTLAFMAQIGGPEESHLVKEFAFLQEKPSISVYKPIMPNATPAFPYPSQSSSSAKTTHLGQAYPAPISTKGEGFAKETKAEPNSDELDVARLIIKAAKLSTRQFRRPDRLFYGFSDLGVDWQENIIEGTDITLFSTKKRSESETIFRRVPYVQGTHRQRGEKRSIFDFNRMGPYSNDRLIRNPTELIPLLGTASLDPLRILHEMQLRGSDLTKLLPEAADLDERIRMKRSADPTQKPPSFPDGEFDVYRVVLYQGQPKLVHIISQDEKLTGKNIEDIIRSESVRVKLKESGPDFRNNSRLKVITITNNVNDDGREVIFSERPSVFNVFKDDHDTITRISLLSQQVNQ